MQVKIKLSIIIISLILILTSCFSMPPSSSLSENPIDSLQDTASFHFIDVGQGDCILIQSGKTNIMIDAGTGESGRVVCEYLKNMGIKYLDCFIGTHPHEDHLGGASAVFSAVEAEKVYMNGEMSSSYFFEKLVDAMIEKDITPVVPEINVTYEIGPFKLKFLSPKKDYGNSNDNSLVVKIEYENISALFMGDAEIAVENDIIKSGADINADILKVGHHGSRYASSSRFLNAVKPVIGVIQSQEGNSYGHPHSEAIKRLERSGIKILRCDNTGNIVIKTDGEKIYDATGEIKTDNDKEIEVVYIGNKKSKVFHSEVCPNLPGEKNRVIFSDTKEAENAGYKACGNCNP